MRVLISQVALLHTFSHKPSDQVPQQFFTTEAAAPKKSLGRHIPPPHSHSFSFFLTKCHRLPPFSSPGQLCTHLASGKPPAGKILLAGRSITYTHGHSRQGTIKGSPKGIKQGLFERYSQMLCMLLCPGPSSDEGIKYNSLNKCSAKKWKNR